MNSILQWALILISIPLIVMLVLYTLRRAKELDDRIEEYHQEQEAAKQQPGPVNPYADMASVFGTQLEPKPEGDEENEEDKPQ